MTVTARDNDGYCDVSADAINDVNDVTCRMTQSMTQSRSSTSLLYNVFALLTTQFANRRSSL